MIGDVLAVGAILLGGVFLLMGITGSYPGVLKQLGITLPSSGENATNWPAQTSTTTPGAAFTPYTGAIGV